ncbi:hypothetical protein HYV11_01810 [Candidatus Dependentiae bacterium]|nr:hypothetical protein [Candidatus Dependentiae bacterium]
MMLKCRIFLNLFFVVSCLSQTTLSSWLLSGKGQGKEFPIFEVWIPDTNNPTKGQTHVFTGNYVKITPFDGIAYIEEEAAEMCARSIVDAQPGIEIAEVLKYLNVAKENAFARERKKRQQQEVDRHALRRKEIEEELRKEEEIKRRVLVEKHLPENSILRSVVRRVITGFWCAPS